MQGRLKELMATLPQQGAVRWIGVRTARGAPMKELERVVALTDRHLDGDRHQGRSGSKRQVTLIQAEHLPAIAGMLGRADVEPALLRRNLLISGLNLLALKDRSFRIGDALLEYTGLCHPCSTMETTFGPGGYNAVRGHGGITARILEGGEITIGSAVAAQPA